MRETNYAINLPAEAFTACPSCRSSNYQRNLALDAYCHGCGWDSSSAFIEAGGMEALIYEYEMRLQSEVEQDSAARMRKRERLNSKHQMARREFSEAKHKRSYGVLDVLMMQHLPGSIFSDRSFRCQGCGQGPVMAGDGFMMNRCLNCGRYQHATELGSFDFTWVHARVMRPWRRLKLWLECRSNRDGNGLGQLKATCEESGGVK